jgi:flagellar biogenesis protein FliO
VYLAMSQAAAEESATIQAPAANTEVAIATASTVETTANVNAEAAPLKDSAVVPAAHEVPIESASLKTGDRYLAPPSARLAPAGSDASGGPGPTSSASQRLAEFGVPMQSMYTVVSALAIVIGAFLLFAWALKRGGKRASGRRGALPADVVSVLGRVPLAARQFAELLRVGNKLVLVSLTPTGAETLTEVTDPAEVDRLVGLCQQGSPFSTTKAFEQVFQQMSNEPASSSFLGNESLMASLASPAGAYRANRGGTARG